MHYNKCAIVDSIGMLFSELEINKLLHCLNKTNAVDPNDVQMDNAINYNNCIDIENKKNIKKKQYAKRGKSKGKKKRRRKTGFSKHKIYSRTQEEKIERNAQYKHNKTKLKLLQSQNINKKHLSEIQRIKNKVSHLENMYLYENNALIEDTNNDTNELDFDPPNETDEIPNIDWKNNMCLMIKIVSYWAESNIPLTKIYDHLVREYKFNDIDTSQIWKEKKIRDFCDNKFRHIIYIILSLKICCFVGAAAGINFADTTKRNTKYMNLSLSHD